MLKNKKKLVCNNCVPLMRPVPQAVDSLVKQGQPSGGAVRIIRQQVRPDLGLEVAPSGYTRVPLCPSGAPPTPPRTGIHPPLHDKADSGTNTAQLCRCPNTLCPLRSARPSQACQ